MRTGIFIDGGHFFFTSKYTMYSTFVANSSNNLRLFFHPSTLGVPVTSVIVKGTSFSIHHFRGVKDARRRADHSRCITAGYGSELTVMLRMPKQFPTSETYTSMYKSPPGSTSSKVLFTQDDSSGSLNFPILSRSAQGAG